MKDPAEILFHDLVELSPPDREAYFQQRRIAPELRKQVELLLHFDAAGDDSLSDHVAIIAERWLDQETEERCGPYRLVRLLAQGGMGSVYLAERADGEVQQRVAIKFLHHGGDAAVFRERFLRERQILATLNHHGIARLLDAGHTAGGRPYLAMDYIDGVPIDVYAANLDVKARLSVFLRVCDAVSYAHRNLVIHRDLKPSNILVKANGEPTLLDFGIAKIIDATRDQTRTQERALTPEYASPEQVRGAAQSTATDIYSLGAVLYKLLTGRAPHASCETRETLAAAICATDPPPASSVADTPADLDYVISKALRKEPEERYRSVEALADDIRAFLEFRPVRARSGNAWYRTRKFVRRYWIPVSAAALVLASLGAGLYVANRQRAIAQRRFTQVRQLANKVLALDDVIRFLPGSTKARQEIVAMSEEYLEALSEDARTDQQVALETADAYAILARAQGVPIAANLGEYAQAEASLEKASSLLDSVLRTSPHDRKALFLYADVSESRMILADTNHRREDTLKQARNAARYLDNVLSLGPASPSELKSASGIFSNVALALKNLHLYQDSARAARRSIEIGSSPPQAQINLADPFSVLADSLRFAGDLEGALQAIREARSRVEKFNYPGETVRRSSLFNVLWREGVILGQEDSISLERPDEAVIVLQRAFDLTDEWARRDSQEMSSRNLAASAARELGKILAHRDPRRSLEIYDEGIRLLSGFENAKAKRELVRLLAGSSYPLRDLNRNAEARKRIDAAFELLRQTKDYPADRIEPGGEPDTVLRASADSLAADRQPDGAAKIYRELLDKTMAYGPDPQNDLRHAISLSRAYSALGSLDRRTGRFIDASRLDALRLDLWKHWNNKLPNNPFVIHQLAAATAKLN